MKKKNCDFMVINKVGKNLGFEKDDNHVFIFSKDGREIEVKSSKKDIAEKMISHVIASVAKRSGLGLLHPPQAGSQ